MSFVRRVRRRAIGLALLVALAVSVAVAAPAESSSSAPVSLLVLAPASLDFGTVIVGQAGSLGSLTVANTGGYATPPTSGPVATVSGPQAGDFSVDSTTCTTPLGRSGTCTITVRFVAAAAGSASATLSVNWGPALTATAALSGTGSAQSQLMFVPNSVDFGSVRRYQSSNPVTFTLVNTGDPAGPPPPPPPPPPKPGAPPPPPPPTPPAVSIGGANADQFVLETTTCSGTVPRGGTCTATVHFFPTIPAAANAALIVSWGAGLTASASVTGTGITGGAVDNGSYEPGPNDLSLWAWVTPGSHDTVHIVAAFKRFIEPSVDARLARFSSDALYQIHIARGPDSLNDVVTYQFRFTTAPAIYRPTYTNTPPGQLAEFPYTGGQETFDQLAHQTPIQTYSVTKIANGVASQLATNVPVAPANIGPQSDLVLRGATYDDTYARSFIQALPNGEGRVWAGPRADPDYADLGGINDILNFRARGTAQNGYAHFNMLAVALDVPASLLTADGQLPSTGPGDANLLGLWISASRPQQITETPNGELSQGPDVQIARSGLPDAEALFIGAQDKTFYERSTPTDDMRIFAGYFDNPILVRDALALGFYQTHPWLNIENGGPPLTYRLQDLVPVFFTLNTIACSPHHVSAIGDVLRLDPGCDSAFPNGRTLTDNASDLLLAGILETLTNPQTFSHPLITDGVAYPDGDPLSDLPWAPAPWRGFDQGHGTPTP
jgi:hypothetical protein